jgi:hypothetical protein
LITHCISHRALAFIYLGNSQIIEAQENIDLAISIGQALQHKAPKNQDTKEN